MRELTYGWGMELKEAQKRTVESFICYDDAVRCIDRLDESGIRAFVWEYNYAFHVVVSDIEDLERAKKLA